MRMHSGRGRFRQLVALENAGALARLLLERQTFATVCGHCLRDNLRECVFRKDHIVSQQFNRKHYAGSCYVVETRCVKRLCCKNTVSQKHGVASAAFGERQSIVQDI